MRSVGAFYADVVQVVCVVFVPPEFLIVQIQLHLSIGRHHVALLDLVDDKFLHLPPFFARALAEVETRLLQLTF